MIHMACDMTYIKDKICDEAQPAFAGVVLQVCPEVKIIETVMLRAKSLVQHESWKAPIARKLKHFYLNQPLLFLMFVGWRPRRRLNGRLLEGKMQIADRWSYENLCDALCTDFQQRIEWCTSLSL